MRRSIASISASRCSLGRPLQRFGLASPDTVPPVRTHRCAIALERESTCESIAVHQPGRIVDIDAGRARCDIHSGWARHSSHSCSADSGSETSASVMSAGFALSNFSGRARSVRPARSRTGCAPSRNIMTSLSKEAVQFQSIACIRTHQLASSRKRRGIAASIASLAITSNRNSTSGCLASAVSIWCEVSGEDTAGSPPCRSAALPRSGGPQRLEDDVRTRARLRDSGADRAKG